MANIYLQHEEEDFYLDISGNMIGAIESHFVVDLLMDNHKVTELVSFLNLYHE